MTSPLRVDFAGGWLDVPRFAIPGAYIVNCAISPLVELDGDRLRRSNQRLGEFIPCGSGLGTSAAWHALQGRDAVQEELDSGRGWQDAAVIRETGLCVWASGSSPELVHRDCGESLTGLLALLWTGKPHVTADLVALPRDYTAIANAAVQAFKAVSLQDVGMLADAITMSYEQQLAEGMERIPTIGIAGKYCGAGHGGFAVYLFESHEFRDRAVRDQGLLPVEPHCK